MKHFQRAYLRPFPGLNVLASLQLVIIQPNSKLHPPHQNFLDPLLRTPGVQVAVDGARESIHNGKYMQIYSIINESYCKECGSTSIEKGNARLVSLLRWDVW